MSRSPLKRQRGRAARIGVAVLGTALLASTALAGTSSQAAPATAAPDPEVVLERFPDESTKVVEVELADTAELDRLVATGVDLDHGVEQEGDVLVVRAVVTDTEIAALEEAGYTIGETLYSDADSERAFAERAATIARTTKAARNFAADATHEDVSDVKIVRADYYTSFGVGTLSVEAKWANGLSENTPLTVERDSGPGTPMGSGGTQVISRFVDAGAYLYHRGASNVMTDEKGGGGRLPVRPDQIRITSPSGDVAVAKVRDWLPTGSEKDPFKGAGYQQDFVNSYLTPTDLYARIKQLADTYPDISELIALPNQTNGYRRKAMAMLEPTNRLVMTVGGTTVTSTYAAGTGAWAPTAVTPDGFPAAATTARRVTAAGVDPDVAAQACQPLSSLANTIAVVERGGTCTLEAKALAAQTAGAVAVLLANNTSGAGTAPTGTVAGVTIPVVGISNADAAKIRNAGSASVQLFPGTTPGNASRIGIETRAWGHEGGNDVTAQIADPGVASSPLSISVTDSFIKVNARTDASGAIISSAAEVIAALRTNTAAMDLVDVYTYRGNTGAGVVSATPVIALSDNLSAPQSVSREPQTVWAIKIGKTRDGSKPGVLAYAQEHAREWVPPLVTLETAERLLRNYDSHAGTRELVDNLEIWIAPSINPDGGHYSFYDYASQRRNMKRYCTEGGSNDVLARNQWGVDVNRNFEMYSAFDGYSGATPSTVSCTSDTNAGPAELSEPEAQNVDWIMAHPNIKFSMNMHSSGNYFMWAPGAYKTADREASPRPSVKEEAFFWEASEKILTGIKRHRGLSVTPARTGPIIDVLYSAAGNSGDQAWYKYGIYGWSFEVGSTFQPPFRNPNLTPVTPAEVGVANAKDETLEYANGLIELVRVARDLDVDVTPAESTLVVTETADDPTKVNVRITSNESADIHYTLDGTQPTAASPMIQPASVREPGEKLVVDKGTRIYWYSEDSAGNIEAGYDPTNPADTRYRKGVAEAGWAPTQAAPTVTLSVSPASLKVGQSTAASVTVTATNEFGLAPSGQVVLTAGGQTVGAITLGPDGTGTAQVGPFTTAGTQQVQAAYAGDDLTAAGTSAPVPVTVTAPVVAPVASSVAVTKVAPGRIKVRTTQAKVTVKVAAPGAAVSGKVEVRFGGTVIGTGRVDSTGRVVITLKKFAKVGSKTLTVRFLGTPTVKASSTTTVVRVVR
ncbi:M14 family zinc carboxypeptidase [Nocardioides sp. 1609]|uniref:M14 family zinc carboxypeptidase n=1 Tax=Nocardioides sp. 1609 TaxID=2508327 RepID=UPI00106F2C99|nr:M14 family zinc carboxypeptidase [Nocardioides sp. 1609]